MPKTLKPKHEATKVGPREDEMPYRMDPQFAKSLIGSRCFFSGIDDDSTSTAATIIDADALVAVVKCSDGVFFAKWPDVAIYLDQHQFVDRVQMNWAASRAK